MNPVSKIHIDALVYAWCMWFENEFKASDPERVARRWEMVDLMGQHLWLLNVQRSTARWEADEDEEEAAERQELLRAARNYKFEPLEGIPQLADILQLIEYWRYHTVTDEDERPDGPLITKSVERLRQFISSDFRKVHGRSYEHGDSTLPWGLSEDNRDVFVGKVANWRT